MYKRKFKRRRTVKKRRPTWKRKNRQQRTALQYVKRKYTVVQDMVVPANALFSEITISHIGSTANVGPTVTLGSADQ